MAGIWEDREFISRYSSETVRLQIVGVVPTSDVIVDMVNVANGVAVFDNRIATPEPDGVFAITLGTPDTKEPGYYDLVWTWMVDAATQEARTFIWVGQSSALYDALDEDMQALVMRVWWRFADLFDSPLGGPYLQTQFQTKFTPNRLSQIASFALGRLNTIAQPHQTYTLNEPGQFPHEQWGALLEFATYIETIKHLMRSYVEQPDWQSVTVARADRRDYLQRWQSILDMEEDDLKKMLDVFKIAHMGLGRPHVLVSGGVYGNYGPTRYPSGSWASRPRFWARFQV